MKQWGLWHYCKSKCSLPFFSKKWSQKVILCTIFHKFDLFFLFGFNITKMDIFCNFFKRRLLLSQTKDDFLLATSSKKINTSKILVWF